MLISELVVWNLVELELPESCPCGFSDLKIHGTRINGRIKIEVQCMRCGKPLVLVER